MYAPMSPAFTGVWHSNKTSMRSLAGTTDFSLAKAARTTDSTFDFGIMAQVPTISMVCENAGAEATAMAPKINDARRFFFM